MKPDEDLNVTQMFIEIKEQLAKLEVSTSGINITAEKADKAYSRAKENTKDIEDLKESSRRNWYTVITALVIPIGLFIFEKFIGG